MELLAVIKGLEALKRRSHVELFTDSEYVRQGLMQWMAKWKANAWRRPATPRGKGTVVKNLELWKRLDELVARHELVFHRVAGHSGHSENDRCDQLAVAAYQRFLSRR
jgi:ribonuclease HI